jgi:hypothetical protein
MEKVGIVVIDASVGDERATLVREWWPTLRLKPEAKLAEVIWELENLSGQRRSRVN